MRSVDLALITATIACAFMVDICYGDGKNKSIIITKVTRNTNYDLYYIHSVSGHYGCRDDHTFMVEGKIYMKNKYLFKGKIYLLIMNNYCVQSRVYKPLVQYNI